MENKVINLLKAIYQKNKLLFVVVALIALLFIAGCAASSPAGPTSQFIGGGC